MAGCSAVSGWKWSGHMEMRAVATWQWEWPYGNDSSGHQEFFSELPFVHLVNTDKSQLAHPGRFGALHDLKPALRKTLTCSKHFIRKWGVSGWLIGSFLVQYLSLFKQSRNRSCSLLMEELHFISFTFLLLLETERCVAVLQTFVLQLSSGSS